MGVNYFNIIQALCRSALIDPSNAVIQQVNRLKDAILKDGFTKEGAILEGFLTSIAKLGRTK